MMDYLSEPCALFMTISGNFNNNIDLEMLSLSNFPNDEIIKFVGYNKIYWYNENHAYHSDENKIFFNQCNFEFKDKISIRIFANGSFIVTGIKDENTYHEKINIVKNMLNVKKYIYHNNKLELIYSASPISVEKYKIILANYCLTLDQKYEFNPYKIINLKLQQDEDLEIESITDIFFQRSTSIKFKNINGNVDLFKNKVICSFQNVNADYDKLIGFVRKYMLDLISERVSKNQLSILHRVIRNKTRNDKYKLFFEL